jgi:Fur family ferric uptake transcriptional regulator
VKKFEAANAAGGPVKPAGGISRRNTPQKAAVKHALGEATGFVSAQQLHQTLKKHGSAIGLATVYRALADLAVAGEADSLQSKDAEVLYRACTTSHHHHLICRKCGLTLEIEAQNLEKWADQVAKEHGFAEPSHNIDIFGICAECR